MTDALKTVQESSDPKFAYMLLNRLQDDIESYISTMQDGIGNTTEERLWAKSVEEQIQSMLEIHEYLPEKPKWLTLAQIHWLANKAKKLKASTKVEEVA